MDAIRSKYGFDPEDPRATRKEPNVRTGNTTSVCTKSCRRKS